MSWETVRNLKQMQPLLLIIKNICVQGNAPKEILDNIQYIDEILKKTIEEFHN